MTKYLLDTNILIYALKDDKQILACLNDLIQDNFMISAVSYFEVLIGASRQIGETAEVEDYLKDLVIEPVTEDISKEAVRLDRENMKKLKYKDLIIAATAKLKRQILITADRDFKNMKGIQVECVQAAQICNLQ